MEEINATDLRVELTHVCDAIIADKKVWLVTRYGKKLALLIPYSEKNVSLLQEKA